MDAAVQFLFLFGPALFGLFVAVRKPAGILKWLDRLDEWASRKYAATETSSSRVTRWFLRPWLATLRFLSRWTDRIQDEGIRGGVRIGAYLYATWIVISIALAATVVIAVIALVFVALAVWGWISSLTEGEEASRRATARRLTRAVRRYEEEQYGIFAGLNIFSSKPTEFERLKNKFGTDFGRMDEDGKIYSGDLLPIEIGFVDSDGTVYDTRKMLRERVGRITEDGRFDER
jgi:hypothetical protein